MNKILIKASLMIMLAVPLAAIAAPITYDITFTVDFGEAPTSASYTYDADTLALAALEVIWQGITFANFQYYLDGCGPGGAGFFALLQQDCGTGTSFIWIADSSQRSGGSFSFNELHLGSEAGALTAPGTGPQDFQSSGSWATAERATNVPEPGTLALLGLGLAGMGFARRRKTTQI